MTNRDYPGTTYYTIRNVSLYECLGWCRDEVDCSSASFSFVVNPLAPLQETTCRLQNESAIISPTSSSKLPSPSSSSLTSASSPSNSNNVNSNNNSPIAPQKAVNLYYFTKTHLRSGKHTLCIHSVCTFHSNMSFSSCLSFFTPPHNNNNSTSRCFLHSYSSLHVFCNRFRFPHLTLSSRT